MKELILLLPEIYLALTIIAIVVSELSYHGERTRLVNVIAFLSLGAALIQTLLTYRYGATQIFNRAYSVDGLSLFFKLLAIILAAVSLLGALQSKEIRDSQRSEFVAHVLASTLAVCVAVSASDLILVFLALQLLSLVTYFLASFSTSSSQSIEAGFKHWVFSGISAVFFLFGVAILFAATHSVNIHQIHDVLVAQPLSQGTNWVVFGLLFFSLAFYVGAFPMHLWAPDVLEGSPTPVSGFLAMSMRIAGFVVMLRCLLVIFSQPGTEAGHWKILGEIDWTSIVAGVSGASLLFGSVLALVQESSKRMLAYLLVAQSGLMLLGAIVLDSVGISAVLFSIVSELIAVIGAFYMLSFLVDRLGSDRLTDFKGVLGSAVYECVALILFLASLVGIPPLPGFISKFTLIGAAIRHHWYGLALLAMLSMAISTAAVTRLAFSLVGNYQNTEVVLSGDGQRARILVILLFLIPLLLCTVFAQTILDLSSRSLHFILW